MSKAIVIGIWALAAIVVILLITLPISLQAHLIAGTVALAAMIVLKLLRAAGRLAADRARASGRRSCCATSTGAPPSTLPPVDQLENFIPGLLLYLAELYSVGMLGLSLFVVAMPLPRRVAPPIPEDRYPTVDVFVPTYNEDAQLLATTLAAAKGDGLSARQAHRLAPRRRRHRREMRSRRSTPPPPPRRRGGPSCRRFARASASTT